MTALDTFMDGGCISPVEAGNIIRVMDDVPVGWADRVMAEADVEAWLSTQEATGHLWVFKSYTVNRAWGPSRAWTVGVVCRTGVWAAHVQEYVRQFRHRGPSDWYTDKVTRVRLWGFQWYRPNLGLVAAPDGWDQAKWDQIKAVGLATEVT